MTIASSKRSSIAGSQTPPGIIAFLKQESIISSLLNLITPPYSYMLQSVFIASSKKVQVRECLA